MKNIYKKIREYNKKIDEVKLNENRLEKLRKKFVSDYSKTKISKLKLREYCIGGKQLNDPLYDKTFCYRIEQSLRDLGSFRGSFSTKFGVYRSGNGDYKRYITWKNNNKNEVNKAFLMVKSEIISLLKDAKNMNIDNLEDNKLFNNYKLKILSVYYPNLFLPIFSLEDMNLFLHKYGKPSEESSIRGNITLLKLKNSNSISKVWTNYEYMRFLFDTYKNKKKNKPKVKRLKTNVDYLNLNLKKHKRDKILYPKTMSKIKTKVEKNKKIIYLTNPYYKKIAIQKANYKCELCNNHTTFIRKKDNTPYMEAHHLVPMENQGISKFIDMKISLDTPENIISLCSNCHNKLHYGKDIKPMIDYLYKKRRKILLTKAIDVSLDELYAMYGLK